jgi:hypothetical protein
VGRGAGFRRGVKEEEGEGEGAGGVAVEAEERASGTSLPAHAIEVEVREGTVEPRSSPKTDSPERRVRSDDDVRVRLQSGEGASGASRGRHGEGDGERGERGIAEQGRVRVVVCCVRPVS